MPLLRTIGPLLSWIWKPGQWSLVNYSEKISAHPNFQNSKRRQRDFCLLSSSYCFFTLPKLNFHVSLSTLHLLLIFRIMGEKGPTISKEPSIMLRSEWCGQKAFASSSKPQQSPPGPLCRRCPVHAHSCFPRNSMVSSQADTPGWSQLPATVLLKSCRHHLK